MILYRDVPHTYTNEENGASYRSVTSVLGTLKTEKDWDEIKRKYAKKNKLTVEEVTAMWKHETDKSIIRGTNYHLKKELEYVNKPGVIRHHNGTKFDLQIVPSMLDENDEKPSLGSLTLEDGIYPELIVWLDSVQLAGQADRVEIYGDTINIIDYKGLALDTPLATPSGWTLMNDIKEGDIVYDKDGIRTKVKHVSEVHYNPTYRIKFDTNDELVCDHEHKWVISFRKSTGVYKDVEMTTDEIYHHMLTKPRTSLNIPKIKCTNLSDTSEVELPIDPYVLGLWLGDGSKACGVITNIRKRIWDELDNRGYNSSGNLNNNSDRSEMRTVYGLHTTLRKLNLLNNKHIPCIYLRSSRRQRLDLLRGFMDADGYFNEKRKRFVMTTTQEWQKEAISTLVSSLGWKPTIIEADTRCTNCNDPDKIINSFHITFSTTENPFLCRNEDCMLNIEKEKDNGSYRNIISIEQIDMVPTKCIAVDSPSKTYLAGKNLITTHNTNKKIDTEAYVRWDGSFDTLKPPCNHLGECNANIYYLQLNMYAYMIKKHNPLLKIGKLLIEHIKFDEDNNPIETIHYQAPDMQNEIRQIIRMIKKGQL